MGTQVQTGEQVIHLLLERLGGKTRNAWRILSLQDPFTILLKGDILGTAQVYSESGKHLSLVIFLRSHQEAGGTFLLNSTRITQFPYKALREDQETHKHVSNHSLRAHLLESMLSLENSSPCLSRESSMRRMERTWLHQK